MNAIVNDNPDKKSLKHQTKPDILKTLMASNVLYHRFFETAKEGILILDAETGRIVDVNPFLIKLLGYVKRKLINKEIWEVSCFNNIVASRESFFELQKKDSIYTDELLLIADKGRQIYVKLVSNTFLAKDLKIIQWSIRDITKHKQEETERLIKEAQMRMLVQAIPDLIWLKDVTGVYLSCNIMFERYLGATEAEIIGKTYYDFIDHELADTYREHDVKVMNAGKATSQVGWVTFADDGHRAYLDTIKTPLFDSAGMLIGLLGIGHDFTAFNLRREKELQANEMDITIKEQELIIVKKQLVFQNKEKENRAAELIIANKELAFQDEEKENRAAELIIADEELAFQNEEKENRAAELIIANKELVFQNGEKEKRAAELIIANTELAFQNEEKEKRAAELIIANKELVFQNEEKEKRAAELSIANSELIFQNKEKEKRAAELIIAKENAEESDKLKTAFLQNMSHEIRTPLNGIIGFSSLLNDEDISKDEIKEYTTIITRSGKRLIEIVNNVLDISKIQTGQVEIKQTPILINKIFMDLFTFFSPIAYAKNIRLNFHNQDDESRIINSDEAKLNQILTNLINNAIKFTKSGTIDYGFESKDTFIQFYVKDTGIGIKKELYERIFDRFIQAEQTMNKNYGGTGLGLAISKGLVELLGGKIWVESVINEGTTFFFTLPYEPAAESYEKMKKYLEIPVKHINKKVLVAEDDWVSFRYINKILTKLEITVIHVDDGAQAVEKVRTIPDINLIMMDIRMPVMDGIKATKLIKQIRPDLPIIAQTAYAFEDEKNEILLIGCDEYLAKPLDYVKLDALLSKYLK